MGGYRLFVWLALWLQLVTALEVQLDQGAGNNIKCEGMYSKKAWGGAVDPYIMVKFLEYKPKDDDDKADPLVATVVFNWKDQHKIGGFIPNDPEIHEVCDKAAVDGKLCNQEHFGKFILNGTDTSDIETDGIHTKGSARKVMKHSIKQTGYYCVGTVAMDQAIPYTAIVEFRNAYGELPGAQIPKLAFYGGIAIVYALIGIFWAFLYIQNRSDILAVQNYVTATLGFLVVETIMTWGYYDYMNRHGQNYGARALMIVVSILNAARNSLSFFLLLIVCMGYGVVKPSLGKTMIYIRWLAISHFVFGVIYAIGSLTVKPEDAGPLVLLVVFPLAATGTAFYVWTLNALGATLKDLIERKQRVKAMMYRKLWWCILLSIVVIFGFFFLNVLFFSGQQNADFTPQHWQSRWFVLDGWLSLVYLADVAFVAYIWRPTANNRRFAMSDEINQDDEGFEIASVRDSLDELVEDEHEADAAYENGGWGKGGPPAKQAEPKPAESNGTTNQAPRAESPLPAPTPQKPPPKPGHRPTDSMEGETIFAVGEDGDKSDEEDSDSERKGLTGKSAR